MPTKLNALARSGLNTECACTNVVGYRICRQKRVEVEEEEEEQEQEVEVEVEEEEEEEEEEVEVEVEVEEGRSSRGTGQQK
ncbi:hypothetical protein [Paenibacillus odorifer]|uniref:hypothetical protein n=1 Tax=Paenibacillus odorifer TaxID=189426 RepID=UPI0015C3DEC9|nr:hypothetical protein [Paenibacillus odorifer]